MTLQDGTAQWHRALRQRLVAITILQSVDDNDPKRTDLGSRYDVGPDDW